jgi:hypothetical protein
MKSLKLILATIVATTIFTAANAQEKMYVMKDKAIVFQSEISNIDSIIFHDPVTTDKETGVLINGVVWATRNIDAPYTFVENPQDTGMYYQWNRNVGWTVSIGGRGNSFTPSDGISELTPPSDYSGETQWVNDPSPAGWKIPTKAQFESLTDTEFVSRVWTVLNSVNGMLFTDLQNGNSIFLPAAGEIDMELGYPTFWHNDMGFYRSSTHDGNYSTYKLSIGSGNSAHVEQYLLATGELLRCVLDE